MITDWWYADGNFAWSAVFVGLGWFAVWVAGLALLAIRAARVWLAFRKWGIWIMLWAARLVIFASVAFFIASWLGTAPVDVLVSYSAAIESLPYVGAYLGEASPWPLVFVSAVFGSICVFIFSVVMGTVADVFSLIGKLLAIVYHGGILFADRVEPQKPIRWVGLEVLAEQWDARRDRRRKAADTAYRERAEERLRRRAEREALSEIGPDGFTLFDESPAPPVPASERVADDPGEADPGTAEVGSDAAPLDSPAEPGEPARADDDDVEGAVRPPVDTPDRDADLAVESPSPDAAGDSVSEADALESERAREAEEFRNEEEVQGAYEEHQSRMDRQRQTEVDEYAAEEELLLGTVDEEAFADDPFDPGYGDEAEYEGAPDDGWNMVPPPEEAGQENVELPFGSAFKEDAVEESAAEVDGDAGEGDGVPPEAGTEDPLGECPIPDPGDAHGHVATDRVAAEEDASTGSASSEDAAVAAVPSAAPQAPPEPARIAPGDVASAPPEADSERPDRPGDASTASAPAVVSDVGEVPPGSVVGPTPETVHEPGSPVVPEAANGPLPSAAGAAVPAVEDEPSVGSGRDSGESVAAPGGATGELQSGRVPSALEAAEDAPAEDDAGGWSVPEDDLPEDLSLPALGLAGAGPVVDPSPAPVGVRSTDGAAPGGPDSIALHAVDGVVHTPPPPTDDPDPYTYPPGDTGSREEWERVAAGGPALGPPTVPDPSDGARPDPAVSAPPASASAGRQTGFGFASGLVSEARWSVDWWRWQEP